MSEENKKKKKTEEVKTEKAEKEKEPGKEQTETSGQAEKQEEKEKSPAEKKDGQASSEDKNAKVQDNAKSEKGDEGKGFFSRKDPKDEKIAELTDKLQRQLAEFDNYRKRTEKEKASMYDLGAGDVIAKVLDVADNFERGLKGADLSDPFADGMNKVYKQLQKVLSDLGVTAIEAEGKPFDPALHNAVMHEENPDVGENVVTQELQKGYKYKDTVIRHSMVKVAN